MWSINYIKLGLTLPKNFVLFSSLFEKLKILTSVMCCCFDNKKREYLDLTTVYMSKAAAGCVSKHLIKITILGSRLVQRYRSWLTSARSRVRFPLGAPKFDKSHNKMYAS
jgi:hypothetical protein